LQCESWKAPACLSAPRRLRSQFEDDP
jgi:hypothetical protein